MSTIIDPTYEPRTIELARRCTDDIAQCDAAEVSIVWRLGVPLLRFVFGELSELGRPSLNVQLVAESRSNPMKPGRVLEGDQLRRHVRDSVEGYLKLNGIEITRKVLNNASL